MAVYGDLDGVQALVPEVGAIDSTSTPTDAQVEAWQNEAAAKLHRAIGNAGYSTPIAESAALYAELTGLENLYAAAYTLRARSIDTVSGESEQRSEVWLEDFYAQLKDLAKSNLALLGAVPLPATTPTRHRRGLRTIQMRKVDGYSRGAQDRWDMPIQGEYTGANTPAE